MFQTKIVEKIKTHCVSYNFFSKNRAVYEIMWKNMVQPDRHRWYGACAVHAGYLMLQTHTINMEYLQLSQKTMVMLTRFSVRLYVQGCCKSLARPTTRCILFDGENISLMLVLLYI